MEKTRTEALQETLVASPDNTFARYALAMELSNSSDPTSAWQHFEYLLSRHPDYAATYYQAGKFLAKQRRVDEAKRVLAKGIEVTGRQGNLHAQSELQQALDELARDGSV
jgi:thioredoxin-like negative regulator of GroEL